MSMRFIRDLSYETTNLLQKVYQKSQYHRVRQRAQCILLSYQGHTTNELTHIFNVDRITIYNWFNAWASLRFPGLYDRKEKGRPPSFNEDQKEQIRQWAKMFPKNLHKIRALIRENFGLEVSKDTVKRVLKSLKFHWRRIRRRVKGEPDSKIYQERKESLDILIEEDKEGIIDLRYLDESGFCLAPMYHMPGKKRERRLPSTVHQVSV